MSEWKFPWRTALFVSLALNLLAVGAVAGALWAGVRVERGALSAGAPEAVERMPGTRAILRRLPENARQELHRQMAASAAETSALREASWQVRREAYEIAASEPYDIVGVRAAFTRLREADQAAIAAFHDDFTQALASLSATQRSEALASLRRVPGGWRERPERGEPPEAAPRPSEALREKMRERRERLRQPRDGELRQDPADSQQP